MLRFYDNETPNSLAAKQAQKTITNLPISEILKEEMREKLENNSDFSEFINKSSQYLKPFYEKNGSDDIGCNDIHVLALDIESFYIILTLKDAYDALPNKDKDFNSSLKIFMGYLCALAQVMNKDKDKNILKVYRPMLGSEDIYARFFCDKFDEKIFRNIKQFNDFRYGLEGAKELLELSYNPDGTLSFSFLSKHVLSYFQSANPHALLENRTDLINKFINDNLLKDDKPNYSF